jgi:hypothetical protein
MGWDGMGWDGMGWDGMGWDGMGWDGHKFLQMGRPDLVEMFIFQLIKSHFRFQKIEKTESRHVEIIVEKRTSIFIGLDLTCIVVTCRYLSLRVVTLCLLVVTCRYLSLFFRVTGRTEGDM